jgi:hypothetical protein
MSFINIESIHHRFSSEFGISSFRNKEKITCTFVEELRQVTTHLMARGFGRCFMEQGGGLLQCRGWCEFGGLQVLSRLARKTADADLLREKNTVISMKRYG